MEIIDSHIHYWEPDRPERPWDKGGVDLGPPHSVDKLLADAKAAGVTKVVQVTPTIMGYDNRYSIEGAQKHPDRVLGVFCRFDPTAPDMPRRLEQLSRQPTVLGIRLTLLRPPFTGWLADGTLERFLAEAGSQGVVVAIYAPREAKALGEVVRRVPRTRVLIDHMALRYQDAEPFSFWPDVLALADLPNLWMKASYFPEVAHEPYPFKTMQGYFRELHGRFGADRLIWGSNYPPSAAACPYKENVDFTKEACDFLTSADKEKIFAGTLLRALGREAAG